MSDTYWYTKTDDEHIGHMHDGNVNQLRCRANKDDLFFYSRVKNAKKGVPLCRSCLEAQRTAGVGELAKLDKWTKSIGKAYIPTGVKRDESNII